MVWSCANITQDTRLLTPTPKSNADIVQSLRCCHLVDKPRFYLRSRQACTSPRDDGRYTATAYVCVWVYGSKMLNCIENREQRYSAVRAIGGLTRHKLFLSTRAKIAHASRSTTGTSMVDLEKLGVLLAKASI